MVQTVIEESELPQPDDGGRLGNTESLTERSQHESVMIAKPPFVVFQNPSRCKSEHGELNFFLRHQDRST